jgi:hypothetical protein
LAHRLGISRAMLDFARKGERGAGPKLLRRLELLEAECGLKTFPCPVPTEPGRLRWCQFIRQEEWPVIAAALRMTTGAVEAVLSGDRGMTPDELRRLAALESASHITVGFPPPAAADRLGPLKPEGAIVQPLDNSRGEAPPCQAGPEVLCDPAVLKRLGEIETGLDDIRKTLHALLEGGGIEALKRRQAERSAKRAG